MRYFRLILLFTIILFFCTHKAQAHTGGGPPFLLINQKYAQTNVYYIGTSSIIVPQDQAPDTYAVNTSIKLAVDTNKLLVPTEIANNSTFRWSFSENSKAYKYGKELSYTYKNPGSYLISLDVKAPGETDFLNIDTVQVNVLRNSSYYLPKVEISLATQQRQSDKDIVFKNNVSLDPKSSLKLLVWDFGDGTTSNEQTATHRYKNFDNYVTYCVILRIIDTNGMISDTGVIVESINKKLVFVDKNGNKNAFRIDDSLSNSSKLTNRSFNLVSFQPIFNLRSYLISEVALLGQVLKRLRAAL